MKVCSVILLLFVAGYSLLYVWGECETSIDPRSVNCIADGGASYLDWNINDSDVSRAPSSNILVTGNSTCGKVLKKIYPQRDGNLTLDLRLQSENFTCNKSQLTFIVYGYHRLGEETIECTLSINISKSCSRSNFTHSTVTIDTNTGGIVGLSAHGKVDTHVVVAVAAAIIAVVVDTLMVIYSNFCLWLFALPVLLVFGFLWFRNSRTMTNKWIPEVHVDTAYDEAASSASEQVTFKGRYRHQRRQSMARDGNEFKGESNDGIPASIKHIHGEQEKKPVTGCSGEEVDAVMPSGTQPTTDDNDFDAKIIILSHKGSEVVCHISTSTSVNIWIPEEKA